MTVSLWQRAADPISLECDLAIVGAGIAGLSAALTAGRRGLSTVILERERPGAGASGRNAGFLIRGAADNYALAAREWGRDRAATVWRITEENHRLLRSLGVGALDGYRQLGSCVVALEPVELGELRESLDMLREDGFEAEWIEPGASRDNLWQSGRALGGLLNPGDAICSPVELLGLLEASLAPTVNLVVGGEVMSIAPGPGGLHVSSRTHRVRAERVLICTNAYSGSLLPSLADLVTPRRGQLLQIAADGASLDHAYYANRGSEYFRPGPEGTLLVGGCRTYFADQELGLDDRVTEPVQSALERFASEVLGVRGRVLARWAGTMGFSPDGLPLVGPVPVEGIPDGSVWFCGGFTGHGMSMAHKVAADAVDQMLGHGRGDFPIDRLG